jgi:transposase
MISAERQAQILRCYHVEKWRINTIARQLHVHHSTVCRVLAQAGLPRAGVSPRPSAIDAFVPMIVATLERFPTLTAARLYVMARERGYAGSASQFRHRVALLRPRRAAEAYLRLRTVPAEQAQVDWGHFGHLQIGRARRPLMAFVMVLSYSRMLFVHFYLDARMASFLDGHVLGFAAFGGVPRVILYDNLKSAVLERIDEAIRFHPTLLAFAAHQRYEPRPVAPARGNEKGRVERAIRYVRDAFFAARRFGDLEDLNRQAAAWCADAAAQRRCPEDDTLTVAQAFEDERGLLLPLPEDEFDRHERVEAMVGKTPYVRFDLNDYSVPHECVRRRLSVLADPQRVRVLDGIRVVAEHRRSWDRGAQIEDEAHLERLRAAKRRARGHSASDALIRAVPGIRQLLTLAAARGHNLGSITAALARLRQQCTIEELDAGVAEALAREVPHPNAVRLAIERLREARAKPPVAVTLPEHLRRRDVLVRPHQLASYDAIKQDVDDDAEPR